VAAAAAALEPGVVAHVNEDHADAVALMALHLAGLPGAEATLCGFDAEGCDVRAGARLGRIAFPEPAISAEAARAALARLAREARAKA
jgi:putative heme iron utilization protein